MPRYLIKVRGRHIDYIAVPKTISASKLASLRRTKRHLKGRTLVRAKSWRTAVNKILKPHGVKLGKRR